MAMIAYTKHTIESTSTMIGFRTFPTGPRAPGAAIPPGPGIAIGAEPPGGA
jgi:hypothetical protein